jgi:hypothetical protein
MGVGIILSSVMGIAGVGFFRSQTFEPFLKVSVEA